MFQWANILLLWLTCFCFHHSFAQNTFLSGNLLVEHFGVEEGLPENLVTNVLQDRKGFLWMPSAYSLIRYDGYAFKSWRLDEASAGFSHIHAHPPMLEDGAGNIWFIADKAILVFNPKTERFSHVDVPFSDSYFLRKDHLGNIWTSPKDTLTRIAPVASKPDSFALLTYPMPELNPERAIQDFIFDESGHLWLSMNGGEIWRMPVAVEKQEPQLLFDKATKIKTAGENASLFYRFVYNPFKKELCAIVFEGPFRGRAIRELSKYDEKKNVFSAIQLSKGFEQVFSYRSIEFDGQGNLWIADWGGGVFRITDFDRQPKLERVLLDTPFPAEENCARLK